MSGSGGMGNNLEGCCAPDRSALKRSRSSTKQIPECYGPPMFEGAVVSLDYSEWEEIIALSRAITPGGKLLGLSSTKKMLCTLHKAHAPMLLPGFGGNAQHFYSIQLWEVNRAVGGADKLRSQLSSSSNSSSSNSSSNSSNNSGNGGGNTTKNKIGENTSDTAPKTTPVALLELEPGIQVHQIVLLDSANPQYVVGTVSRRQSSKKESIKEKQVQHELYVWRLEPTSRKITEEDVANSFTATKTTQKNLKKHKLQLKLIVKLKGNQPSRDVDGGQEKSTSNGNNNTNAQPIEQPNNLLSIANIMNSECKTMTTLRDYLFVGDDNGNVFAWAWTNWYNIDWRRVNRRRRRASLASKQRPLTPTFEPLAIHGIHGTSLPHPGGVTCIKVSHARTGMELYTCGNDHTIKMWRIVPGSASAPSSPSSSSSSAPSSSPVPAQRSILEHVHTIDATAHGMYNLRCLEVSQTPDVGAAWYAASHGHHAAPSLKKKASSVSR